MGKRLDLIGQIFGRLTVKEFSHMNKHKKTMWRCECDCGNEVTVHGNSLMRGDTKSCGCYNIEKAKERFTTHGKRYSRVYRMWANMLSRCNNPETTNYEDYGGRGIRVTDRWFDFENFYADMSEPLLDQTLDRIDCDGDYCPDNCRWADIETQNNNKRNTHWVEMRGLKMSLTQWSRFLGLKERAVSSRVRRGWTELEALTTPVRQYKRRKQNGIKNAA